MVLDVFSLCDKGLEVHGSAVQYGNVCRIFAVLHHDHQNRHRFRPLETGRAP